MPYTSRNAYTNPITTEGDGAENQRAGILGDLFNLLGRSSAASAQAAYNATDNNQDTSIVGGLMQGLKGQGTVSYKDVLRDNLGVKNRYASAIGGFVGDVALDPLTYVGLKGTKGVDSTSALIQAIKSGSDDVASEASRIMAANPTRVGLTVMGKEIGSAKVPGSQYVEKLLGPETDRKLSAKLFSRSAELPLGLNEMSRVIDSSHSAKFDNFRRGIKSVLDGLTPQERETISLALDKGESLGSVPVMAPDKTKFKTLGEYVDLAKKIQDDLFVEEGKLGLFTERVGSKGAKPEDFMEYNPKYVYRFFKNPPKDITEEMIQIKTKVGGPDKDTFMMRRKKDISLQEAKDLGFDPVTDIGEILDMRAAKHFRTTQRAALMRDAIDKFGISVEDFKKLPKGQVQDLGWVPATKLANPAAQKFGQGKMIPAFAAKSLDQIMSATTNGTTGAQAMKLYDKWLQRWKFFNTAASPGYHIRNSFGDILMNMADGVYNPMRYGQAFSVMADRKAINEASLLQLADPTAMQSIPKGLKSIKLGGSNVKSDVVWDLYAKSGAKSGMITSEVQRAMSDFEKRSLTDYLSKQKARVADFSDYREDTFRLVHFIDAVDGIMKSPKNKMSLEEAAMEAGKRVRKYNIDYGNLSSFERNVVNKIIPFYSWMRRATPLQMELLFTKPGFMAAYPKSQDLLQGVLGTDDGTGEQLIPKWIREMAPVRVALAKQESRNLLQRGFAAMGGAGDNEAAFLSLTQGTTPFDTLAMPGRFVSNLAQGDIKGALTSPADTLANGLTPALKVPIELATGKTIFNDQPTTGKSLLTGLIGPSRVVDKSLSGNYSSLGSFLTGLPIQAATGARQESEFRRREDAVSSQQRAEKESILRKRVPNYDELSEAEQEKLRAGLRMKTDPAARQQRKYLTQILGQ